MKTYLFIPGFVFMLSAAHAQTPVSQGKLDPNTGSSPGVVYLQGPASPLTADSKPAIKQAVSMAPQAESQAVGLSGAAQPWSPDAKPAEKRIIVTAPEPAKGDSKQISSGALQEIKD